MSEAKKTAPMTQAELTSAVAALAAFIEKSREPLPAVPNEIHISRHIGDSAEAARDRAEKALKQIARLVGAAPGVWTPTEIALWVKAAMEMASR